MLNTRWRRQSRNCAVGMYPLACAGALALAAGPALAQDNDTLKVVSWGGEYEESQRYAYFEPYTEKTGVEFEVYNYEGDFDRVIEQVEGGDVEWQLVDVTLADAVRGCDGGYLEPIPPSILQPAPDGTPPMEDFLPNTLHECAVGLIIWSTLFVYDVDQFDGDEQPASMEDVFDTERFPGTRGFRRTARNTLEYALMGDGVAPEDVYVELDTEEGVDRAFAKLDEIRDDIRWWEDGATPQQWLTDGEVAMTTAYNGRAFHHIMEEDQNWEYIWDGQMLEFDLWAIPRGADNLSQILDFVAFSTGTEPLAEQTEVMSYAPARRSSLPLVRDEYRSHLPTAPANMRNALHNDFIWWAENQEEMDERFAAWLDADE